MKILQINAWQGRLLKPLLALIREEAPDIIFAQEIYSYSDPIANTSPWNNLGTLQLIASENQFEHIHFSVCTSFPMFGNTLEYGNAILSRYKLEHRSTHYTGGPGPLHLDKPSAFDSNATRNFQHAIINTGKTTLNLINHHGHWVDQPLGDQTSTDRLLKIAGYINELEGKVVACGDLNLSSDSPALKAFIGATGLRDHVAAAGITSTLSAAHYIKNIACDYVLTSPDLPITQIETSHRLVSDHKAVIAEIDC